MTFESNGDKCIEPLGLTESNLLFEKLKFRSTGEPLATSQNSQMTEDSETDCIQDSWGTDGIICNLPSELTEKCTVESGNKERKNTGQDSKTENFKDSWGTDGIICNLPSELTEKKKNTGIFWFPRRGSSNNSMDSRDSSYMGPKPLGPDGKPLRSCMSASNSVGAGRLDDSEASASHLKPKPPKRNVSFDQIHFREYERALGDNPSVSSGPPLSIGWAHTETVALPLDDYEELKPKSRTKEEFEVPAPIRALILQEQADVGRSDLRMAEKEVNIIKNQRRRTSQTMRQQGLHETVETVQRKLKRVVTGKSKQKEEDELWEKAQMGI
jgi:hypothetical protein